MKNKVMIGIIGIAVMLIIVVSTAYAYFTPDITKTNEEKENTKIITTKLVTANLEYGDTIESDLTVYPGRKFIKTIRVTSDGGDQPLYGNITITPDIEEFGSHIKYSVYALDHPNEINVENICGASNPIESNNKYYDAMSCDTSDLGSVIQNGTLAHEFVERVPITIDGKTDTTYYVIIEYENDQEKPQDSEQGKSFKVVLGFEETNPYKEEILNGADPVLASNLIPVKIENDGTVKKANPEEEWYSYEKKNWANAIILENENEKYKEGEIIPEEKIESYFVWIPKYSYQLWDLGGYTSATKFDGAKVHVIPIRFGTTNTSDEKEGECATPMLSGESGSCVVGDYMTHPAFISMNTNGLWVGKFETGYKAVLSTTEAEKNEVNIEKVQIKPNVYSWRKITLGNAFQTSYEYKRELDSHMMKNTEWGAVAYLQHSAYGSSTKVRINNNSGYATGYAATEEPTVGYINAMPNIKGNRAENVPLKTDGTYTINYLNTESILSSTTGNYTGIYDMSGGASEVMMGYTNKAATVGGSSGITSIYPDFFTNSNWKKYYDLYSSSKNVNYNNRILGDATGEMGPIVQLEDPDNVKRFKSSWYYENPYFIYNPLVWFARGVSYYSGNSAGIFAYGPWDGSVSNNVTFRVVLAVQK